MNKKFIILASGICFCLFGLLVSCGENEEKKEQQAVENLMADIRSALDRGNYKECLDSIRSLRINHSRAKEARLECVEIERDAKIALSQIEIALTDSALQATLAQIEEAPTLLEQNLLRDKRDSLKAAFDVQCAAVKKYREMKNGK